MRMVLKIRFLQKDEGNKSFLDEKQSLGDNNNNNS